MAAQTGDKGRTGKRIHDHRAPPRGPCQGTMNEEVLRDHYLVGREGGLTRVLGDPAGAGPSRDVCMPLPLSAARRL
jgi:hypothetical protein